MIISRSPFRISFVGGGSDYPAYYKNGNTGAVLSTTIDKYCYIQCRHLPLLFKNNYRIVYSEKEDVDNIDQIDHPSARECLRFMNMNTQRVEIIHTADVQSMSGLGTSSAYTVGLLNGLYALNGKLISKRKLAENAIHVEQNMILESVGSQDQIAAAFGGFNKIEFNKDGFDIYPITINREKLNILQDSLMLFYTGFSRKASEIAKEQIKNTPNKMRELKRMTEMVDEVIDILNGNNKDFISDFGILLDESWQIKRTLSNKITNPEIDEIYKTALDTGAIAGKLLGAGGGGTLLFVAEPKFQQNLLRIMEQKNLINIPFKFSNDGSKIIYYEP